MPQKLDNNTIQKIIDMYTIENLSASEIMKRLGLGCANVVSKYLKRAGIIVKSKKERVRNKEIVNDVIKLYQDGHKVEEVSAMTKLGYQTVRSILHDANIEMHNRSLFRKYSIDNNYFEALDTQNKCYVLGYLYADGNVSKKNYYLSLVLQERDKMILEKIRNDMKYEGPLRYKNSAKNENQQNTWGLYISCKKICQDLMKWGIVPNKTFLLKYPDFLTKDQHSHFLRGAMDGDGHITPYNGHNGGVTICGTYDFCFGAKQIVESILPIRCTIRKNKNIYLFCVNGKNQASKFLNWIYNDAEIYLERKYEVYCRDYKNVN